MNKLIILGALAALFAAFMLWSNGTKAEELKGEKLESYCEIIKLPSNYLSNELKTYRAIRCLIELEEKKQAKECNGE